MNRFDLVVIGAGPGGYVAAIRAAQMNATVCVIEKDAVGGVCLNRGCIPTKALVKTAEVLAATRSAADFGVKLDCAPSLDLAAAMQRKDKVVKTLVGGVEALFKSWKITLKRGEAKFTARDKITVASASGAEEISAGAFIIATGSSPAQIPAFPIDGQRILTSDHLLAMTEVPQSLLIIGAGAIGCEWAFIMQEFGSEVTVIEMMDQVAPTEDEMIGTLLAREMKKLKVKVITGDRINSVSTDAGGVTARTASGSELKAEKMLVSIGRVANNKGIGLEQIGVENCSRGFIKTDSHMQTSVPKIYAIGDVVGGMLLAHKASAEGKVAAANAAGQKIEMDYTVVPAAIFTSPEVASVGLREREAKARDLDYGIGSFPIRALGKAQVLGEIAGEIKLVFDKASSKLLGCHIIGPHASDLIHEAALAIKVGATVRDLAETIHAHPTIAEGMMEAAEAAFGLAIHAPKPRS